MKKPGLNEDFICRIWEDNSNYSDLKTCSGEDVEIIDYGKRNYDAGPDYMDAKVRIGKLLYSGSIEIHRSVNDWHLHQHKKDKKYNNVILHVALYENESGTEYTKAKKTRIIPTVILSEFLARSIHEIWREIINNPSPSFKLPCFPENSSVTYILKKEWIEFLSIKRLMHRSERMRVFIDETSSVISKKIYWEMMLFEYTCEALGFSKNKEQFRKLSDKIDLHELQKKNLSLIEIDSVLFGLSGFLSGLNYKDSYISELKSGWNRLKSEIRKEPMDKSEWNFFRLRPPNFPTLRIAYASGFLYELLYKDLFRDIIRIFENEINVKKEITRRFSEVSYSGYWSHHYNFGKLTASQLSVIGKERITDIIVNVILPIVILYSELFNKVNLKARVEYFFKKEKQRSGGNEVIRVMEKQTGIKVNTIADEQGLIQLHNNYCVKGKCSKCEIGKIVFSNDKVNEPLRIILY